MLLLGAPLLTASVREPKRRRAHIRRVMLDVGDDHGLTLVLGDLHRVVRVADRAVIERMLDAIVREFLAHFKCLTKLRIFSLPSVDGADTSPERLSHFEVCRAADAQIGRFLTELRLIIGRAADGSRLLSLFYFVLVFAFHGSTIDERFRYIRLAAREGALIAPHDAKADHGRAALAALEGQLDDASPPGGREVIVVDLVAGAVEEPSRKANDDLARIRIESAESLEYAKHGKGFAWLDLTHKNGARRRRHGERMGRGG
jgi:hypothetical protein